MKRIKCNKNFVEMDTNDDTVVKIEKEEKMGFKNHMDKIIIGGLTGVAALLLGFFIASKINFGDDESQDSELSSETDTFSEFESM